MKKTLIISAIAGILALCSCSTLQLSPQAKEDFKVASMAIIVESTINNNESTLPAFQTALTVIDKIIKDGGVSTRAELEAKLTTALDKVASAAITKYVISKVMDVYDTSSQKLNDVADVSKILINVRAAIKSGITLAASDQRPILIVPAP